MKNPTFATRWNADVIDDLYATWLSKPDSLDRDWQAFFEGFELAGSNGHAVNGASGTVDVSRSKKQARFTGAIYAYRSIGHTQAQINPLSEVPSNPRLSLKRLGFEEADLDETYDTGNYLGGEEMSVRKLLERLEKTYCGPIGIEYLHIQDTPKRRWLQSRIEPSMMQASFDRDQKIRILRKVLEAEIFEKFLHTRYIGQKRFSLEGGETLIACLDALVQRMPAHKMEEIVMGMAHRGRLNVLANILGKSYDFIFNEFTENYLPDMSHGDGDVKYHLGYEGQVKTAAGPEVELRLAANPSHLEAVNPVVQGKARARQRIRDDRVRQKDLHVLIHGDAAIAGQGVVAETFNFSKLKGYRTGGTIHFVVNNQIGFTTDPSDARSSLYCTDVAKVVEAPVLHVNGDDPLACVYATELALDYRQEFGEDVVIDIYCYRRHGHNESDEPKFTQPVLYSQIERLEPKSSRLLDQLEADEEVSHEDAQGIRKEYEDKLEVAFKKVKKMEESRQKHSKLIGSTAVFQPDYDFEGASTTVDAKTLEHVAKVLTTVPEGFKINPKIKRQLDAKWKAYQAGDGLDWAFCELLAFGTLMMEGYPVRLSGQDSERGTFSQRHSAFYDIETRERYCPLQNLGEDAARFCVYNSLLSEVAVLGFDYGYSLDYPKMLAIWEAQFGDFVNGAQVIIDQFITSSESKWQRLSGLVMLLPHGYEGQGPEHSSARLERFLQSCADNNIQVANITTPAQYFHALRRQQKRDFRKPLIVMSPKSLLRSKDAVSRVDELTSGSFTSILDDSQAKKSCKTLVLCSGKVYYDLRDFQQKHKMTDHAIIRVEQFYPLNEDLLKKIAAKYSKAEEIVWCQEEPQNMGGWSFIAPRLEDILGKKPRYAGRDPAASPATGSLAMHKIEQAALVDKAFA